MVEEIPITQLSKKKLDLQKGIVVVYGSEEYLHKFFLQKLKKEVGNYNLYHGEDVDLDKLVELMGERTLFSGGGRAINVLWQAEKFLSKLRKKQKEKLVRLLQRDISNLLVFSITSDLKKSDWNREPYKTLKGVAKAIFTAKSLNRNQIAALIRKKFQKEGIEVPKEVVEYLLENFTDLVMLKNELEKLITYAADRKTLTLEEVKALTFGSRSYTPFDLQRVFFAGDLSESLKVFRHLLEGLTSYEQTALVLQLQGLILSTANKLLLSHERVKNGEKLETFAREIGLYYPFQVAQFKNWLQLWDEKRLVNLLRSLYKLDTDIKLRFLPAVDSFRRFLIEVLG